MDRATELMDWFETLFGFSEGDWAWTQEQFQIEGDALLSKANGKRYCIGEFSTPSLGELREVAPAESVPSVFEHVVVDDIFAKQADAHNAGDCFQVASQFNTLEFPGPETTPEDGVTGYALDPTQGPACALAAAPAAVYRNYFAPVDGEPGQRAGRQINTLSDLENALGSAPFWSVRNGYTHSTAQQLERLNVLLAVSDREHLLQHLRIGVQRGVEVPFSTRYRLREHPHKINQTFCSAISCAYTPLPNALWHALACMVLDAAYEATLLAAAIDRDREQGSGRVWLTMLGGGVFGNDDIWIYRAIERALRRTQHLGLQVKLVHYRKLQRPYSELTG